MVSGSSGCGCGARGTRSIGPCPITASELLEVRWNNLLCVDLVVPMSAHRYAMDFGYTKGRTLYFPILRNRNTITFHSQAQVYTISNATTTPISTRTSVVCILIPVSSRISLWHWRSGDFTTLVTKNVRHNHTDLLT